MNSFSVKYVLKPKGFEGKASGTLQVVAIPAGASQPQLQETVLTTINPSPHNNALLQQVLLQNQQQVIQPNMIHSPQSSINPLNSPAISPSPSTPGQVLTPTHSPQASLIHHSPQTSLGSVHDGLMEKKQQLQYIALKKKMLDEQAAQISKDVRSEVKKLGNFQEFPKIFKTFSENCIHM